VNNVEMNEKSENAEQEAPHHNDSAEKERQDHHS